MGAAAEVPFFARFAMALRSSANADCVTSLPQRPHATYSSSESPPGRTRRSATGAAEAEEGGAVGAGPGFSASARHRSACEVVLKATDGGSAEGSRTSSSHGTARESATGQPCWMTQRSVSEETTRSAPKAATSEPMASSTSPSPSASFTSRMRVDGAAPAAAASALIASTTPARISANRAGGTEGAVEDESCCCCCCPPRRPPAPTCFDRASPAQYLKCCRASSSRWTRRFSNAAERAAWPTDLTSDAAAPSAVGGASAKRVASRTSTTSIASGPRMFVSTRRHASASSGASPPRRSPSGCR